MREYAEYQSPGLDFVEQIPAHWKMVPFRHVFTESREVNGKTPVGPMLSVSGYRGVEVKEYDSENRRRTPEEVASYRVVRPGQLAVNTMWLNYAGLGVSDFEGHMSPAYRAYNISPSLEPRYVHHLLRSSTYVQGYTALLTGIRPNSLQMSRDDLMNFPVILPPLEEQRLIADYLDRETAEIDAFIMELDRFMILTEERRNAARSEFFSPSHAENLLPIKRVARLAGGAGFPPAYQGITDEELPFYKVGSLNSAEEGKLTYASDSISRSTARSLGAEVLPAGSVVMAKIGAALFLRRNALLTKPGCIDNNMLGLIPASLVDGRYLQEVLLTLDLTPIANPGAVPSLNMRWFRETKIEVPSLEVQNEVLARFSELDSAARLALADAAKTKELAQERRSALISAAVTGQINVAAQGVSTAEQLGDELEVHV